MERKSSTQPFGSRKAGCGDFSGMDQFTRSSDFNPAEVMELNGLFLQKLCNFLDLRRSSSLAVAMFHLKSLHQPSPPLMRKYTVPIIVIVGILLVSGGLWALVSSGFLDEPQTATPPPPLPHQSRLQRLHPPRWQQRLPISLRQKPIQIPRSIVEANGVIVA